MKLTYRLVLYVSFLMFSFSLLLVNPLRVSAQSSTPLKPNPVAEAWVLNQVKAGEIADLENRFPNEEDRVLGADFLVKLLENPTIKITRSGIRVKNAIFIDPLDLKYTVVDHEVQLEYCRFEDYVDISESHFTQNLSFIGSTFTSPMYLFRAQIDKTLRIGKANFENSTDFRYANLAGNLSANDAQFTNKEQNANFNNMRVEGDVLLRGANFAGPVDFRYVDIGNNLEADDVRFNNAKQTAYFGQMKVGYSIFLRRAVFAGPVDFRYVDIGNNLEADDVRFNNAEQGAIFWNLRVGNIVFLNHAVFAGPVNFQNSDIGNNFEAAGAQFNYDGTQVSDDKQIVNKFSSMKVGNFVFINQAVFSGPVDFRFVEVGNNFEAAGAQFNYDGPLLNDNDERLGNYFASMKVRDSILLNSIHLPNGAVIRTIFAGPVDFRYVEAGINFDATEGQFNYAEKEAVFWQIKADAMILNGAVFAGGADFRYSEFRENFEAIDTKFKNTFQIVNFNHMRVDDTIFLTGTCFAGPVLLTNSKYGIFHMQDVTWSSGLVKMEGMTYQSIVALRYGEDVWQELNLLVDQSLPYNAQTYKTLETFFENQGYPERADQVYIASKKREGRETLNLILLFNWRSLQWWKELLGLLIQLGWNTFLYWFIRYGRSPEWAFFWSAVIVYIGLTLPR